MRILFVCTGNICRSPLAEHLLRQVLAARGVDGVEVASAGVFARPGAPALEGVARAAAARGLDLSAHRARPFDGVATDPGDLILVMEEIHRRQVLAGARVDPRNVRLLGRFAPDGSEEIGDPIGGPTVAFEQCIDRLKVCVEGLAAWLEEERILRT